MANKQMILPFVAKILPFTFSVWCVDYNQAAYWMRSEQEGGQNGAGSIVFSVNHFFKTAVSLPAKDLLILSASGIVNKSCVSSLDWSWTLKKWLFPW